MADSMKYRYLGRSGLKVSALTFGNMTSGMGMFSGKKDEYDVAVENHHYELMERCISKGINFFDTAEIYGGGLSEVYLGNNIRKGGWNRDELILTTKFHPRAGGIQGNSLKRIRAGADQALKRLQLDNVDVAFLHRPDPHVPLKEQVRAINELVEDDKTYYWGTSEFASEIISEIFLICEKYGFAKPIVDQCEYNMLTRKRVEVDYWPLYEEYGYGTMTWSPLYGGMLSGKYNDGIPKDSRFGQHGWELDKSTEFLKELGKVADDIGCSQSQLALAWCLANKDVTTVLFGSTRVEQIDSNVGALQFIEKLTPEVQARIETLLNNRPDPPMNFRFFTPREPRR
jgi:voltage-dependent potassium channel beta subunit